MALYSDWRGDAVLAAGGGVGAVMSKYNAIRTQVDGIWFDSKAEAERFGQLKLLEDAGKISELKIHPKYPLEIDGNTLGHYEADFSYIDIENMVALVVEDVKGVKTPLYRWKKKHFEHQYAIKITEVTKGRKSRTLRRGRANQGQP